MSVYVGKQWDTPECWRSRAWPYKTFCHLLADNEGELDEFAAKLMLNPKWKQNPGTYKVHYDLTDLKRRAAVRMGAIEISPNEEGRMLLKRLKEMQAVKGGA